MYFYLNDHYMAATDYVDALDAGIEPEPDSQYFVAPYIQEIFSEVVETKRPDIAAIIKNKTSMYLS